MKVLKPLWEIIRDLPEWLSVQRVNGEGNGAFIYKHGIGHIYDMFTLDCLTGAKQSTLMALNYPDCFFEDEK
jgi:hypothetical protein